VLCEFWCDARRERRGRKHEWLEFQVTPTPWRITTGDPSPSDANNTAPT
jgi:hypothetical protein